jgi:hypothetical protein
VIAKEIRKQASPGQGPGDPVLVPVATGRSADGEEALQMARVVRFFRIVAVLAIPAAVLFLTTGNHVHGL